MRKEKTEEIEIPERKDLLQEKPSRQGRYNPPIRLQKERDLTDLQDMVVNCVSKLSFLGSFFCERVPDKKIEMGSDDVSGLYNIITDIQDDLDMVVDELSEKMSKGLIIEKEMS